MSTIEKLAQAIHTADKTADKRIKSLEDALRELARCPHHCANLNNCPHTRKYNEVTKDLGL